LHGSLEPNPAVKKRRPVRTRPEKSEPRRRKKLNKPLLTILWMLLLTLPIFAETSLPSKTIPAAESNSSSSLKIDWPAALPMMTPEEAKALGKIVDEQVEKAFEEGYKAAEIRFEAEADYWKFQSQQSDGNQFWNGFQWGAGTGAVVTVGVAIGIAAIVGAVSR
jgi:hypothetical protein